MALYDKSSYPLMGIWKMDESPDELLAMLENKADYQPFLERVVAGKRRQERLASRVLLKELLGKETKVDYRPNGAPFLPHIPLYISASHTKGHVAVILSGRPTGIDIEYRSGRVLKIRSRFMNPDEEASVDPLHEEEHLLVHWCAKETLFKVMGQENVDFLKHLHVNPFLYADQGTFTGYETRTTGCKGYELAYKVTSEYVLTYII